MSVSKKYVVLRDCYGFRNSFYTKGQIVEVNEGETPPGHFELVDGQPANKKEPPPPIGAPADKLIDAMSRKDLIATAKGAGIQNAHMLSTDKLRETLKELHIK
jgi:hypothetical protein